MTGISIEERFYPEVSMGGFTRESGAIEFYSRIAALLKPGDRVLDYGAGRGAQIAEDKGAYSRSLKTLKGRVAHVEGCDVDPAVLDNPYLDHAEVIDPSQPLPYPDNAFDLIMSSWVFEHVDMPEIVSRELMRVLKPGGYLCAVTPNKFGYVALASRMISNAKHVSLLRKIQPDRLAVDVFPTRYRLNTRAALQRYFGGQADIVAYGRSAEPSYHFNSAPLYRLFQLIHKLTPPALQTAWFIFIRKRPDAAAAPTLSRPE